MSSRLVVHVFQLRMFFRKAQRCEIGPIDMPVFNSHVRFWLCFWKGSCTDLISVNRVRFRGSFEIFSCQTNTD